MNITEDYVSFEVAKLLKERGFDEKTLSYYKDNVLCRGDWFEWNRSPLGHIAAPTHQMTMKWLREKYYIYADPIKQGNYNDCSEYYTWIVARMGIIHRNSSVADKLSYEEAVEAALKYSLENLI